MSTCIYTMRGATASDSYAKGPMNEVAELKDRQSKLLPLSQLLLDKENPRFGLSSPEVSQADILDRIVEKFGVDDVLSSLAVNGYFEAEPIVCRHEKGAKSYIVAEGNRRLAACLILTDDDRASRQKLRRDQFFPIWEEHGKKQIDPVPCIIFEESENKNALLSYLGVRHISSAQPWDSYAKAAWVARVVENANLKVADVALMIGDQHRTIARLLEGYYFINQLIEAGEFRPEDSQRKGRGSVTEYPFSWVYTLLGYNAARSYLRLPSDGVVKNPIGPENLKRGKLVARAMFGDRSKGQSAAISDSRELGDLASALASPEKISLLEQGLSITDIQRITKPLDERLRSGLAEVREIQSGLTRGLSEQEVPAATAEPLVDLATKNRNSAADIARRLKELATGEAPDG